MKILINQLNKFNLKNFPTNEVSKFLDKKTLNKNEINDYSLFLNHKYARNLVYKDRNFEILVVCWKPGQKAPIHGHEGEKCWMRIEAGSLQISNYRLLSSNPISLKLLSQDHLDEGCLDGPAEIHSVENISNENAISLHVYTKPFNKCDVFYPEKGIVERKSLAYDSINKIPC